MAVSRTGKAKAPTAAAKASPVTLKHLAARLAKDHQLTKRAGEAILGDLVSLITKHLKKGERVRISGFGILQVQSIETLGERVVDRREKVQGSLRLAPVLVEAGDTYRRA